MFKIITELKCPQPLELALMEWHAGFESLGPMEGEEDIVTPMFVKLWTRGDKSKEFAKVLTELVQYVTEINDALADYSDGPSEDDIDEDPDFEPRKKKVLDFGDETDSVDDLLELGMKFVKPGGSLTVVNGPSPARKPGTKEPLMRP